VRTAPLPVLFAVLLAGAAVPVHAEATRVLRFEASAGAFAVENLAGRMSIRAGTGDRAVVVATVHAETEALAAAVRLESVKGDGPGQTIRVRYPGGESTIRYRGSHGSNDSFLVGLFTDHFQGRFSYDGRSMQVSSTRGKLLYADVEVEVPAGDLEAAFRNRVGAVSATGLSGRLSFDVASADLRLDHLQGDIRLSGSSGDVLADDIRGSWKSDFSSGDVVLERFAGERADFHSSSGDVRIGSIDAASLSLDTSSGDLRVTDAETLQIVRMVLVGGVNRDLVATINRETLDDPVAVGVAGEDGGLLVTSPRDPALGFVGDVAHVRAERLHGLLDQEMTPVVSTIGADPSGQPYNINADEAAMAIAVAMKAEKIVYLTAAPGLLEDASDETTLVPRLTSDELRARIAHESVSAGMIPKLRACADAVDGGVGSAHIIDGRVPHALLIELLTDQGIGTMVKRERDW